MNEETKRLHEAAHRRVAYLWFDLKEEERQSLLAQTKAKMEAQDARLKRDLALAQAADVIPSTIEGEPARVRKPGPHTGRYLPTEYPDDLAQAWEEICGLNLDDGWGRLCCLTKITGLCFFIRERYEEDWMGYSFSRRVKDTKGMKVWPYKARSKANPYKWASTYEVQIARFKWHEDLEQYEVKLTFPGEGLDWRRTKTIKTEVTQTFWFKAEFADTGMGEGWIRPLLTSPTPFPRS
jgi:hypothetical protein